MKITKVCANLLLILSITSCAVHKSGYEYVQVYKQDGAGVVLPVYLTLKPKAKTYDLYIPSLHTNVLGSLNIKGDTIWLNPRYEYIGEQIKPIKSEEITILSIPILLIKQKNELRDITNYQNYPELAPYITKPLYDNFKQIE